MTDLDKKLKELDIEFLDGVPVKLPDSAIEQIKEAFVDNGWVSPGQLSITYGSLEAARRSGIMTGEDWYTKFKKEINYESYSHTGNPTEVHNKLMGVVLEAARRASGVSND